ncbi:MAG: methyltransferase domain-containing protein [Mycobacteriales bacterium]|nr:methyltransferase domain-containing protein [Mycobacteriales bacterium]
MSDSASRVWAADMSEAYDEHLVPAVFRPFADDLAARVASQRPRDVLELAAGTGVLTGALLQRLPGVRVTATDLNVAMVDLGSARVPAATWQQADAMRLPFPDAMVDLVACQFGVMFFPDRPAAYAEVARVLKPGGHVVFTAWCPLATHDVEAAVLKALEEVFPQDPPSFLDRVPHGYHDQERITADLLAAGLRGIRIEPIELECRGRSAVDLARGYCRGTPLRAEIEARGDLDTATRAVAASLVGAFGAGPVVGHMAALVVTAERPRRADTAPQRGPLGNAGVALMRSRGAPW